jgi:predicted O-methyltransferase YrrM
MTYRNIPGDMCDFRDYYFNVASRLPSPCRVIEVGVADGHSAIFLAETLQSMGKKFQLVMVENMDYGKEEQQNTLLVNIIKSGLADHIRLISLDSLIASCKFPDQWADFVFIDASHKYEQTKADIRLWFRKVRAGGILAGHDYHMDEVNQAVKEVIPDAEVFETSNGLGVWQIKMDGRCL